MRPAVVVNNYADHYRRGLFELLARREGARFLLFGGRHRNDLRLADQVAELDAPARVLAQREVPAAIAAERPRVVVASTNGRVAMPAAYLAARRLGVPFVLWLTMWALPRTPAHLAARPLMRRIIGGADAVLTYGPHARPLVNSIRRRGRVFDAPQSTDNDRFGRIPSDSERNAARRLAGGPYVLYCGRLAREKGVEVLARAWPSLASGTRLLVVGEGPHAEALKGLQGVVMAGRVDPDALAPLYSEALCVCVPSVETRSFLEPWGFVCNEALLQGTPVVASDRVGAAAGGLVRDGETGLIVPPGDPGALAAAVGRLLSDGRLAREMGERGSRLVRGAYTHEAQAEAFSRALDAVSD